MNKQMSKQDRQGVRTASDIERKYNLGDISKNQESSSKQQIQIQQLNQSLSQLSINISQDIQRIETFMAETTQKFKDAESKIQTWFFFGVPTLENQPASEWVDDEQKTNHVGDLYYNEDNGDIYLFKCTDDTFEWVKCNFAEKYHITFYDVDCVVIAGYVIKQGDAVKSPIADVVWKDSEGTVITFPYTPTNDTNLYLSDYESTL